MMDCWLEYERGTTRVARIVHQVDKLECLHQAFIYRKRYGRGYNLEDFQGLRAKIEDAWLSKEADRILADWAKLDDQQTLPIIFVIGGPGVGKGTLCTPLSNEIDYEHISVGDLLREEQKKPGSPYASFIAKSIRLSITIPPIITMRLLQNKIEAIGDKSKGILIDGFPRSIEQAVTFEEQVSSNYSTIYLRCSTDILRTRVTERAQFSDRADDDPATFQKRIDSFEATNQLIVDHLSKNRLLNVDASGKIDEVYSSVREFLKDQA
ncbi:hypothetical protein N3K66_009084 [Trichothecium roseum]|nr:hypothetical protein N3K66_009084 [Trichothecium roseum]